MLLTKKLFKVDAILPTAQKILIEFTNLTATVTEAFDYIQENNQTNEAKNLAIIYFVAKWHQNGRHPN